MWNNDSLRDRVFRYQDITNISFILENSKIINYEVKWKGISDTNECQEVKEYEDYNFLDPSTHNVLEITIGMI